MVGLEPHPVLAPLSGGTVTLNVEGNLFIGVGGIIGAGKSTFTSNLTAHLDREARLAVKREFASSTPTKERLRTPDAQPPQLWGAFYEPVETNPYLTDFYKDIARWTFNMQMFLLAARFRQHQEVLWDPRHRLGGGIVQDRTIYEDTIFARMHRDDGLMDDRDWNTYIEHFHIMQGFLRYPDVIVYLRVTPELALERICERGRPAEHGIPLDYLRRLHEGYEEFAQEMNRYTVVVTLDWTNYKPVEEVAAIVLAAVDRNQKFLRSLRRI
jgi:deoxyadenosine/deoxycytidine kinase